MQNNALKNRVAVVTGASSGIGAATAARLVAAGAKVALLARRHDQLAALAKDLGTDNTVPIRTDVTDEESVAAAAELVHQEFGDVDLLVNSAGVMLPAALIERQKSYWEREIGVNVTGVLNVTAAFLPDLVAKAAEGELADLVNISSVAADAVYPHMAVYGASKAAVSHLSRGMRAELGPQGVRVTSIDPGLVATELQSHGTDPGVNEWISQMREQIEWLSAEDIANTIGFVLSQPKHVNLAHVAVLPSGQS